MPCWHVLSPSIVAFVCKLIGWCPLPFVAFVCMLIGSDMVKHRVVLLLLSILWEQYGMSPFPLCECGYNYWLPPASLLERIWLLGCHASTLTSDCLGLYNSAIVKLRPSSLWVWMCQLACSMMWLNHFALVGQLCIIVVVQWLLCTHSAEYLDVFDLGYTQGHVCLSNGHYASQRHLSCVACSDRWNCQWDVWTIYPCIHVIVSATHGELTTILFNIEILHVLSHVTVHFIGDVSISQCICKLLHHNIDYSLVLLHLKMCFCHLGLLGLSWSLLWFVQETACICSCHDCLYHVTDNIHVLYIS